MVQFPPAQEKPQPAPDAPLGVYVHVPFCATTCDFCAFYQTVPKGDAVRQYVDAVEAEAALVKDQDNDAARLAADRRLRRMGQRRGLASTDVGGSAGKTLLGQ